jgi:Rps23 Pro-64 3,4-dihydroxylase Tpa1-like proline 4-hydroxylase
MNKEKGSKRKLSSDASSDEDEDSEFVYFEEESDSEPEINCDKWDNDCRIVKFNYPKICTGYHLMPTCSPNPDENPNKKVKLLAEIRTNLLDGDFMKEFQNAWNKNKGFNSNETEIIVDPFKVCVIRNFLDNPHLLNDVRQEFNNIDWNLRSMDLYEFSQSKDLKHLSEHACINSVYQFLQNDVMKWVAALTGLTLTHISATCSAYSNTDYLLVHDDQREDRMVAFILYLTGPEGWDESKGGALQLLNKDSDCQPSQIVHSILPANAQFVFFPVASDSYHQVSEVTSLGDSRLSINGWFHTKVPPVYDTPSFKSYPDGLFGEKQYKAIDFDSDLSSWLTDGYLECDVISEIHEYFEEHSEISLKNFLREEPFNELSQLLDSNSLSWVKIGPPNRHCYEVAKTNDLPIVVDRFLRLFQSKQMFSLLGRLTGLELNQNKASMKFELQKWTPGCYSVSVLNN